VNKIVTIKFGSHLYGTSTPQSDVDLKSVYIPSADDILLQRVKDSVKVGGRVKAPGEKNVPNDIDEECYSLQRFLSLAAEGQTVCIDMLFAPEWAMTVPFTREWRQIIANRARLLTKKSSSFVGYCRQQANKYGIKGSRVAAAKAALAVLADARGQRLAEIKADIIAAQFQNSEHMSLEEIDGIEYWVVCGRKLALTSPISVAHKVVEKIVTEYGNRARQAESQQGIDWKALSHAVRVGTQAIELLSTGCVTFPLPNAAFVLAIKLGVLPYQYVSAEIEELLGRVEVAAAASSLPSEPDYCWIDSFVHDMHLRAVALGC
jgi:predicted nucleotidyltransferase